MMHAKNRPTSQCVKLNKLEALQAQVRLIQIETQMQPLQHIYVLRSKSICASSYEAMRQRTSPIISAMAMRQVLRDSEARYARQPAVPCDWIHELA